MVLSPEFSMQQSIKEVIERFFQPIDGETPEAGKAFSELFMPDRDVRFGTTVDKGRKGRRSKNPNPMTSERR
jgi:hypothetical protein